MRTYQTGAYEFTVPIRVGDEPRWAGWGVTSGATVTKIAEKDYYLSTDSGPHTVYQTATVTLVTGEGVEFTTEVPLSMVELALVAE